MSDCRKKGFILIAVLWITLLLSIFALNATTKSRLLGLQALNIQDRYLDNQALESALDKGQHEYLKYLENRAVLDNKEEWESLTGRELKLWHPRFEPYTVQIGENKIAVQVRNLHGTLDINQVSLHLLQDIVQQCGVSPGVEATTVVNSILDWMDQDDLRREAGAEKDFYLSLAQPYLPKNNRLQNIHELLLIKGVSQEVFHGTEHHPGLKHFFSVDGAQERMDINSAAAETFVLLDGLTPEIVQDIVQKRKQAPITSLAQLGEIIPLGAMDQLEQYYKAGQTQGVRIQAFKVLQDGRLGRFMSRIVPGGG